MARTSKRRTSRRMRRNEGWGTGAFRDKCDEAEMLIAAASNSLDTLLRGEAGPSSAGNQMPILSGAFVQLVQATRIASWLRHDSTTSKVWALRGMDLDSRIAVIAAGLVDFAVQSRVSARAVDWVPR